MNECHAVRVQEKKSSLAPEATLLVERDIVLRTVKNHLRARAHVRTCAYMHAYARGSGDANGRN